RPPLVAYPAGDGDGGAAGGGVDVGQLAAGRRLGGGGPVGGGDLQQAAGVGVVDRGGQAGADVGPGQHRLVRAERGAQVVVSEVGAHDEVLLAQHPGQVGQVLVGLHGHVHVHRLDVIRGGLPRVQERP